MESRKKVSVDLPSALDAVVQSAVTSGEYASASAVILEALQDWTEKKAMRSFTSEELRYLWNEGKASGTPKPLDMEAIIGRAKERLERSRAGLR
jgi:antitoxin ParD1/3/4